MEQKQNSIERLNLETLSNDEVERILLDMNEEQLSIIRDMAYHYLFNNTLEILNLLKNQKLLTEFALETGEKEKILKVCKGVIELFKDYHTKLSDEDRKDKIDFLIGLRKKLYDLYIALYGYEIEKSYIKEMYEYEIMKESWSKSYGHIRVDKRDIDQVINRIQYLLNKKKVNQFAFVDIVSNILSIIPFRLSKHKYLDVVKATLVRNFMGQPVSLVENQMEIYKMIFNSRLVGSFGVLFDNYFTQIQKYNTVNLKEKSQDGLEADLKEITKIYFEINKLRFFIQNIGVIINRLIALYLSLEKIPATNEFNNFFNRWKQFEDEMDEKLLESLLKISDEKWAKKEKELLDKVQPFEKVVQEAIKRGIIQDNIIDKDVKYTRELLLYYNDINFTKYEALFPASHEIIEKDYLEHLVDNLVQYIDRNIQNMGSLERKFRMRRLLASIELPFKDIGEFLSFLKYSLDDKIVSSGELVFCLGEINQIIDTYEQLSERH